MDIFKGQDLIKFNKRFQFDLDCKKYLSELKWKDGFTRRKCGHQGNQFRKDFARTCNKCRDTESLGADTLFHKVKFVLLTAFHICFEMNTSIKGLSAYTLQSVFLFSKTVITFMHKARAAMKSSEKHSMKGEVHVNEFVMGSQKEGHIVRSYGGKKLKLICALDLLNQGR
jgi:hypothetical protein